MTYTPERMHFKDYINSSFIFPRCPINMILRLVLTATANEKEICIQVLKQKNESFFQQQQILLS